MTDVRWWAGDSRRAQRRLAAPSESLPNNRYAVFAVATGIVGTLMALVAMGWLGILAIFGARKGRDEIDRSHGTQGGVGLVKAGEILGWIAVALTLILIAGYSGVEDTYWRG